MHIIIGSISSVVSRPFAGMARFNSKAAPKPTTACPTTDMITYLAVRVKLAQTYSSSSSSR